METVEKALTAAVKSENKADQIGHKVTVKAVIVAKCKVGFGNGSGTRLALVQGHDGNCALMGSTSLVTVGLLPDKYKGRSIDGQTMASALGKPLIVGKAAVIKYLTDNKITGVKVDDILADATNTYKSVGGGRMSKLDNYK
jgi:hypothetical protein